MPELFKFLREEEVDKELRWTYSCLSLFTFKKWTIKEITITDHPWEKPGREWITKELVLDIFQNKVNGRRRLKSLPDSYLRWGREVYRFETTYHSKKYRLIFWFKDGTTDHLWVRNIHPID